MGRGEALRGGRRRAGLARRAVAGALACALALLLGPGAPAARAEPRSGRGPIGLAGRDADSVAARLLDADALAGGWAVAEALALGPPRLTYWAGGGAPATSAALPPPISVAILGPSVATGLGGVAAAGVARPNLIHRAVPGGADAYVRVQPAALAWRMRHVDLVAAYSFYAPAGRGAALGRGGIGSDDDWTNELATGGTVYLDRGRAWRVSALASYGVGGQPRAADGAHAATVQIQGGARIRIGRLVEVGAAGYTSRRVGDSRVAGDDRVAEPPPPAVRTRQRVFGGGPEVDLAVPALAARVGVRYEREVVAQSRTTADAVVLSLTFVHL